MRVARSTITTLSVCSVEGEGGVGVGVAGRVSWEAKLRWFTQLILPVAIDPYVAIYCYHSHYGFAPFFTSAFCLYDSKSCLLFFLLLF